MPDDPAAQPEWRAKRLVFRTLIARLIARSRWFELRRPRKRPPSILRAAQRRHHLRHVCARLRAVLDTAGSPPDETAFLASLLPLLDIANAYALVRDDLTPRQQATHFRRAAGHLVKARIILAVTDEPSGSVIREENSTLLDAAIEDILGEDVDADQIRRDLLANDVQLEKVLRRAGEMATRSPWSMRVHTTAWPPGLMKELIHIWTAILGLRAGASIRVKGVRSGTVDEAVSPFIGFAKASLELLDLPKSAQTAQAIRAEYRRRG
jgi:hypothetical protein